MPRAARKKSDIYPYHIMSHSITESDLFRDDDDKAYYLHLLKQRIELNLCKVYSYCLMDNHVHIYINPCGCDISEFMRSLNCAYLPYYNRKYERRGPLMHGRFASVIVDNATYNLTLSAYIHNNSKDIPGYKGKEETYRYSSYGIYTGYRKDTEGIVDTDYILNEFSNDKEKAMQKYKMFTEAMRDTGIIKEVDEKIIRAYTENVYKSEKREIIRNASPEDLIEKVGMLKGEKLQSRIKAKYSREASKDRAFVAYMMRVICGYTYKQICECIGNMSMSGVTRLTNRGFRIVKEDDRYRDIFNSLIYSS